MTDDLDTLRPEIRDAVDSLDKSEGIDFAWLAVRAELLRLQSTESRANEWQLRAERAEAELAAAHHERDRMFLDAREWATRFGEMEARAEKAEAELAALKAEMDQLRADAETGKAWRTDSSLEEWFPITAAELKHVKAELAALNARIANSRTTDVFESEGHAGMVAMGGLPCEWIGKNVRMLVEE